MNAIYFRTRARFLHHSRQRFAQWGEANAHHYLSDLDEFHMLFGLSSYYARRRWIERPRPVYYRHAQMAHDRVHWMLRRSYQRSTSRMPH